MRFIKIFTFHLIFLNGRKLWKAFRHTSGYTKAMVYVSTFNLKINAWSFNYLDLCRVWPSRNIEEGGSKLIRRFALCLIPRFTTKKFWLQVVLLICFFYCCWAFFKLCVHFKIIAVSHLADFLNCRISKILKQSKLSYIFNSGWP